MMCVVCAVFVGVLLAHAETELCVGSAGRARVVAGQPLQRGRRAQ